MTDFGHNERVDLINRALRAYEEEGQKRTDTVTIKGERKVLKVIRLNPKNLLLNHDSFRLAGQLRDLEKREQVHANPTSIESQQILESLLRSTSEYRAILDDLRVSGQVNPGLISRDGLLINGNTRVVALRELGITGVDVTVLPEDVTHQDFLDLEVDYQMRTLAHQEYTFTNQLLMIAELNQRGFTDTEIAKKMNWRKRGRERVAQSLRILGLIDEIRSQKEGKLPYSTFDSKKQHLVDLDNEYQRLLNIDPKAAHGMKWARILAIFLNATKDQVREIDEDFLDTHVIGRVKDASRSFLEAARIGGQSGDDLDGLIDDEDYQESINPQLLVKKVLAFRQSSDDSNIDTNHEEQIEDISEAIRLGALAIIAENNFQSMLTEPADVLRETRLKLENIKEKFPELVATAGFDSSKFGYELKKVSDVVADIRSAMKKNG